MKINFRNFQSTSLDFKIILESQQNVKMWFNQLKIFSNHNLKSLTAHHPMWLTKTCLSIMKTKKKSYFKSIFRIDYKKNLAFTIEYWISFLNGNFHDITSVSTKMNILNAFKLLKKFFKKKSQIKLSWAIKA